MAISRDGQRWAVRGQYGGVRSGSTLSAKFESMAAGERSSAADTETPLPEDSVWADSEQLTDVAGGRADGVDKTTADNGDGDAGGPAEPGASAVFYDLVVRKSPARRLCPSRCRRGTGNGLTTAALVVTEPLLPPRSRSPLWSRSSRSASGRTSSPTFPVPHQPPSWMPRWRPSAC